LLANALLELKTPNTDQPVETETIAAKEADVASLHNAAAEEPHVNNISKAATPRMSLIPASINSPSTRSWGFLFTSFINLLLIYNIIMLNYKVVFLNTTLSNSHKQTAQALTDALGSMQRQTEKALVDALEKMQKQTDMAISGVLGAAKQHTDKVLTNVVDKLPKEERTEI
jgi:hypothetical protein